MDSMKDETEKHRWEICPHPYDSHYDCMVTDSDENAREAIKYASECYLWDEHDGGSRILKVVFNNDIQNVESDLSSANISDRISCDETKQSDNCLDQELAEAHELIYKLRKENESLKKRMILEQKLWRGTVR